MIKNIIYTILFTLIISPLVAQDIGTDQTIPMDPDIRIGKLDNGLTYYIRHSKNPKNRGEFYIVHNVGAMQEEDNQNGLAHFLEHMAFNGTKHFPKKTMLEYLASIGVRFGTNVNAFTSRNVTAYNISEVPLIRETIIDTVLLMLHDWSSYITCDSAEIEAERGVIREEWRTRDIPRMRLSEQLNPVMYNHSKYAERNVIGDINIIMNFKRQTLLDFYHKWYRPDLQAVIVIGDFDVNMMENKIKKILSPLPKAQHPVQKEVYSVPDNREPLVGISTDPDAGAMVVRLMYKLDLPSPSERQTVKAYKTDLERSFVSELFKKRIINKAAQGNPYIRQGSVNYTDLTPDKKMVFIMGAVKDNKVNEALNELAIEVERIKKHGFTPEEFNELQANMLKSVKLQMNQRKNLKSVDMVKACLAHFITGAPIPPNDFLEKMSVSTLQNLTLEELNRTALEMFSDDNILITILGPRRESISYPGEHELIATVRNAKNQNITPYVHRTLKDTRLITKTPQSGNILEEKKNDTMGTVEWTLSNGAKVIIKSYPNKKDIVDIKGFSEGGTSTLPEKELANGFMANNFCQLMGVKNFSRADLKQINVGKVISLTPEIGEYYETLSGYAAKRDLETLMQMIHLYVTEPNFDQQEFNHQIEKIKSTLNNRKGLPKAEYSQEVQGVKYNHHPRKTSLTLEKVNTITFEKTKQIYQERFANAGDFTFIFTGDIDLEKLKPLVETYIASLPTTGVKQEYKDNHVRYAKGKIIRHIEKELTTDKASISVLYTAKLPYSAENKILSAAFRYILRDRYMKSIREEKGGAYSVSVNATEEAVPTNQITIEVNFDTAPFMADEMLAIVQKEIDDLVKNGPSSSELGNAQRYFNKLYKTNISTNSYWLETLSDYYRYGIDNFTNYENTMSGLTPSDIRKFAKTVFGQKNKMEFVLLPKK